MLIKEVNTMKKYGDLASGIFLFLFSIALFIGALRVKTLAVSSIGSGFFPAIVAVLLAIVSVPIIIGGIRKAAGPNESANAAAGKPRVKAVIATFLLMGCYAALLGPLGFLVTTAVYLFLQINILSADEYRRPILFGVVSVVGSVSIYFLFVKVFNLMLPAGILG
jgi:putative tricarboxylic transport membrane protein